LGRALKAVKFGRRRAGSDEMEKNWTLKARTQAKYPRRVLKNKLELNHLEAIKNLP
jgi:hypothetical protein